MIFTYFEPVEDIDSSEECKVLKMFHQAWRHPEAETILEGYQDIAENHPRFKSLESLLGTYPEITPHGYRDQCFFRWLCFDRFALYSNPVLILDYDVFPVGDVPRMDWFSEQFTAPTILNETNPCAMFLPDGRFLSTIVDMLFLPTIPDAECGQLHIGDNTVFAQHWHDIGGESVSLVQYPPSREPGLIHFANQYVTGNKSEFIRNYLT